MSGRALSLFCAVVLIGVLAVGGYTPTVAQAAVADYFIVFIPGILGSKLSHPTSGQILWGDGKSTVGMLALTPGSVEARPDLLDSFPTWIGWQDVYGTFDTEVLALVQSRERFVEFSYDWRQDLDVTTERFNDKLQGEWKERIRGKRLIVIAHSMGGVIAWNWKNNYVRTSGRFHPPNGYAFQEWSRLVLLGSPLAGSCEMLRMMLTGYRPVPPAPDTLSQTIGKLENVGYRFMFDSLRSAALTFPSVFQLLPKVDEPLDRKTSCLSVETKSAPLPVDHFEPDIWIKFLFPSLEGWSRFWRTWTPGFWQRWLSAQAVWEDLGLSRDAFTVMLRERLSNARRFRINLDLSEEPLRDRVEYLFSLGHSTTNQVYVTPQGVHSWSGILERSGDGRVVESSATNSGRYGITPRPLTNNHGDLVKDAAFFTFLRLELPRLLASPRPRASEDSGVVWRLSVP